MTPKINGQYNSWNLRTPSHSIAALKEAANFTPATATEAFLKQEIDNL